MGGADIEKPLLEHNQLNPAFPNCPGCKNAYLQSPDAGIPYKQFITVFLLVLCSSLPISSLYPFLYFMVQDFHITKSDKDLGFYVGAIGSAFMVGRATTAVLWGIAADKYGRKPVMLIGLISVMVFHTLFGFSQNFWMAVLTRFLLGLFNGLHGPAKAYASEVSNANHQALGVSIIGTSWGLGLILGPALGGIFLSLLSNTQTFSPRDPFLHAFLTSCHHFATLCLPLEFSSSPFSSLRHCTNMVLMSRRNMQLNSHLRCGLHTTSQYKVQVEVYYLMALIAHLFSLQLEVTKNTVEATVEGVLMCKELEASLQEDQNQAEVLLKKKMVTFLAPLIPTT